MGVVGSVNAAGSGRVVHGERIQGSGGKADSRGDLQLESASQRGGGWDSGVVRSSPRRHCNALARPGIAGRIQDATPPLPSGCKRCRGLGGRLVVPLGDGVALLVPMHRERLACRCARLSAVAIPVTVQAAYRDRRDVRWRGG